MLLFIEINLTSECFGVISCRAGSMSTVYNRTKWHVASNAGGPTIWKKMSKIVSRLVETIHRRCCKHFHVTASHKPAPGHFNRFANAALSPYTHTGVYTVEAIFGKLFERTTCLSATSREWRYSKALNIISRGHGQLCTLVFIRLQARRQFDV